MSTTTTPTQARAYSFTDHSTRQPGTPQPGDRLDREFDAIYQALAALGSLTQAVQRTAQVTYQDLAPSTIQRLKDQLAPSIADAVRQIALLTDVLNTRVNDVTEGQAAVQARLEQMADSAQRAEVAADQANHTGLAVQAAVQTSADDATDAANSANDAALSAAAAFNDEELAGAWAEYMPTEIPARFFAHTSITGQHWSSRWWANQAAAAFGSLAALYLGAHPAPPPTTATGQPIPPGAIYYNTISNQPFVWNGTEWVPFYAPTKALMLTLNYAASAEQTTFVLSTPDRNGQTYTISPTNPEPLDVYLNGARTPRDAPVDGTGDWDFDPTTNILTFLKPLLAGTLVLIDILSPASAIAPSRVQTQALAAFTPIDGTTITYPLRLVSDGSSVSPASAVELFISIDGIVQQPGTDYNVAGSSVTFGEAPLAGARVWAYWYGPGSGATGSETNAPVTATGSTASRTLEDRFAESVNVKDFGAVGDGVTDDTAAIQAAITYACTFTPPKALYLPAGTYLVGASVSVPVCNNLSVSGDPAGTILLLAPLNASIPSILSVSSGVTRLTVEGVTFDGNTANNAANKNSLVQLGGGYSDEVTFHQCVFRNSNGTAVNAPGEQPLTVALSTQAAAGQAVLTFTSVPATIKAGAYTWTAGLDPDMYVVSATATTVTLNRNLSDTLLVGNGIQFTKAFTASVDAYYGSTTILTSDTSLLSVGQTLWTSVVSVFQANTRITAIVANTSITIDRPLLNKLPSGTSVAAMQGHSRLHVNQCSFKEIGQKNICGGTTNYLTAGLQSNGASTLTLTCSSVSGATQLGVYPGQKTGITTPAGVPANTLVIEVVSRNTGANTYTIRLASPLTANVADGTAIQFQTALGGIGYGVWHGWGSVFAHRDAKFTNNHFEHTWSACVWGSPSMGALFEGNRYVQDGMEYRDPVGAPSPCLALANTIGTRVIGDRGTGATGSAIEAQHAIGLIVSGGEFSENGLFGITIAGGRDNAVGGGVILNNNGQYLNRPLVQDYIALGSKPAGMKIQGTATTSQPGTLSTVALGNMICSDQAASPTQQYGVWGGTGLGTFSGVIFNGITGSGNVTALVDPALIAVSDNTWQTNRRVLFRTGTSLGNGADLTADVMQTYTLPAGTLGAVGDCLHIVAGGSMAATTDSKTASITFGGQSVGGNATGATAGQIAWMLDVWITKTGANAQSYVCLGNALNATASGTTSGTRAINDVAAIVINVVGQNNTSAAANSVRCQFFMVELLK